MITVGDGLFRAENVVAFIFFSLFQIFNFVVLFLLNSFVRVFCSLYFGLLFYFGACIILRSRAEKYEKEQKRLEKYKKN